MSDDNDPALELAVVDRGPNMPPYRARKPPTALEVDLCGYTVAVLVLRTHDPTVAALLADRPTITPELVWVRWVGHHDPTGRDTYELEHRGTHGATPAVLYARRQEEPQP